jgi:hypothetical protein
MNPAKIFLVNLCSTLITLTELLITSDTLKSLENSIKLYISFRSESFEDNDGFARLKIHYALFPNNKHADFGLFVPSSIHSIYFGKNSIYR